MTRIDVTKCGDSTKIVATDNTFKEDLVKIIENIDLVNSVLNETRSLALDLLEQIESEENAE
ncbi:MAG: hypothetical protein ACE14P_10445 [Methanotrichaceae archaeon]